MGLHIKTRFPRGSFVCMFLHVLSSNTMEIVAFIRAVICSTQCTLITPGANNALHVM